MIENEATRDRHNLLAGCKATSGAKICALCFSLIGVASSMLVEQIILKRWAICGYKQQRRTSTMFERVVDESRRKRLAAALTSGGESRGAHRQKTSPTLFFI